MKSKTASTSRQQLSQPMKPSPSKASSTPKTSRGHPIAQRKREHVDFLKKAYPGLKTT